MFCMSPNSAPTHAPTLQSAKLRVLAAVVTMFKGDPVIIVYYWVLFCALVVNSVYPFILLNASDTWWRREAVAFVDIGLVRIYTRERMRIIPLAELATVIAEPAL